MPDPVEIALREAVFFSLVDDTALLRSDHLQLVGCQQLTRNEQGPFHVVNQSLVLPPPFDQRQNLRRSHDPLPFLDQPVECSFHYFALCIRFSIDAPDFS